MKMVRLEVNWYSEETNDCELISIFVWPEDVRMIREADKEERENNNNVRSIIDITHHHFDPNKTFITNIQVPRTSSFANYEVTNSEPEEEDTDWQSPMTIEDIAARVSEGLKG